MGYSSTRSTPDFYATASCDCFSSDWISLMVYDVQSLRREGVKVCITSSNPTSPPVCLVLSERLGV